MDENADTDTDTDDDDTDDDDDAEESLAMRLTARRWVENDFTNIMLLSKDGMASSTTR